MMFKGEMQATGIGKCESTEAWHWGGATRSSEEALVMSVERRGSVRTSLACAQLITDQGGSSNEDKTIYH